MKKYLLDIRSGNIIKEIDTDFEFWNNPTFTYGVEFVCKKNQDKKEKFALINKDFEFITDFGFDDTKAFSERLAAVEINGKWGYIDPSGTFEIEPEFKKAYDFENGLAMIQNEKTGKYGYINRIGEVIIGYYDYLDHFSEGLVYAKNKKSKSLMFFNEKGDVSLTMKYPFKDATNADIQVFSNLILQEFDTEVTSSRLQNMNFKMVNDNLYDRHSLSFCKFYDGLCQFIKCTDDGLKVGFYDKTGNIVIPAEFDFASRFCNGISFYSNGKNIFDCKSGILTATGEKIEIGDFYWDISLYYKDEAAKHKLFPIRANKRGGVPNANGKYGFADRTGKIAVNPQFDRVSEFCNGMIEVNTGFLSGFVNDTGEYVISAQYDCAERFNEYGYCIVSKHEKYSRKLDGIIDKTGNIIAPIMFENIEIINENRFLAQTDNGYMLYDISGIPVINKDFSSLEHIYENYALVDFNLSESKRQYNPTEKIFRRSCGEGMYIYFHECYSGCADEHIHGFGLMKEDGTILTNEIFEHIGNFSNGLIQGNSVFSIDDYIDLDGKPVLFNFNDNCSNFIDDIAFICTHDWIGGSLIYNKNSISDKPMINNTTSFFMNKQGDIIDLDLDGQKKFLRKYQDWREKFIRAKKWDFKEFISKK